MATLPKAVQRQLEAADAMLAETNKPVELTTPQEPEAAVPTEQPTPVEPQVQEPAPQVVKPAATEETWEQRYKALQGLFNARIPELQGQNKELAAKLQSITDRMDTLAQQQASHPPLPPSPVSDPKDVDNFGQDLVEMVQRQTHAVLSSVASRVDQVVAQFEKRLSEVEQSLKGAADTVAVTAEEMFFTKLAGQVPDWDEINSNPAFLAWLSEIDPVYGAPRQAALSDAQRSMDVGRVVNIFKAFKGTIPQTPKVDPLEKQVSPKSNASPAPTPVEKPVLTTKQVENFYHDVALGKYRGRDAEVAQLEQVINEAMAEGRIR
jgi:hypothetical protein